MTDRFTKLCQFHEWLTACANKHDNFKRIGAINYGLGRTHDMMWQEVDKSFNEL